jgi:hypothetical protein
LADYADVIADASAGEQEEMILVVHSIAGLVAPYVAERIPLRHVVFLNALLHEGAFGGAPWPDRTDLPMLAIPLGELPVDEQGLMRLPPDRAAQHFYRPDCTPQDTAWAISMLRPQAMSAFVPPAELRDLPAELPRTYVLGSDDQAVTPAWSRWAARELLHAQIVELPGGHSPFLARPRELARVLDRVAASESTAQHPRAHT